MFAVVDLGVKSGTRRIVTDAPAIGCSGNRKEPRRRGGHAGELDKSVLNFKV
jgi:hypothetical protein